MNILVINTGFASFSYILLNIDKDEPVASGAITKIGYSDSHIFHKAKGRKKVDKGGTITDYSAAVQESIDLLTDPDVGAIKKVKKINAIGFNCKRMKGINQSVLITEQVINALESFKLLAPMQNTQLLELINIFHQLLPEIPLVSVCDSEFYNELPDYVKLYGIPKKWSEHYAIQRLGNHGMAHRYISENIPNRLKPKSKSKPLKVISCVLDTDSSICALRNNTPIDISSGFSIHDGLVSDRSYGDIDPFIIPYLIKMEGLDLEDVLQNLENNSGLTGFIDAKSSLPALLEESTHDDKNATLAVNSYVYGINKFIGSFAALLGGIDILVFSGRYGIESPQLRKMICSKELEFMGIKVDDKKNARGHKHSVISLSSSKVKIVILTTEEEFLVGRETARVIKHAGIT